MACGSQQAAQLVCGECQAPLAVNLDLFASLGLPRKLRIDPAALEERYHRRARLVHPDRFANAQPAVRELSLRATALVTRAYRTLRDPAARAVYWLELDGQRLAANNQRVPAALAGLVFEVQDELAELRAGAPDDPSLAVAQRRVQARQEEVAGLLGRSAAELGRVFAELDAADGAQSAALIEQLKAVLAEGAYLTTLMRDLRKALDNRPAA